MSIERYRENKELTSWLLMDLAIGKLDNEKEYSEIKIASDQITQRAKKFEVVRWMKIQRLVDEYNGISGQTDDFKVAAMATAGRLLITISDTKGPGKGKFGGAWISLIGEDGNPGRMGVQGLCATEEEALGLLDTAIEQLPEMKNADDLSIM
ncbi:MAG: hypothetical protein ACXAC5_04010 [Promethearchaeota archaeon]|jgi:hypothetical protein